MLGQRRRRWAHFTPILAESLVSPRTLNPYVSYRISPRTDCSSDPYCKHEALDQWRLKFGAVSTKLNQPVLWVFVAGDSHVIHHCVLIIRSVFLLGLWELCLKHASAIHSQFLSSLVMIKKPPSYRSDYSPGHGTALMRRWASVPC